MIEQILSPELVRALGWTLVHTLWQAAVFAGLLGVALLLLRKHSARMRYLTAIGVLGAFFLTVLLTFGGLYRSGSAADLAVTGPVMTETMPTPASKLAQTVAASPSLSVPDLAPATAPTKPSFWNRMVTYYDSHLPLIVTLWLMGVLILQLRFVGQLVFLQRLKNYGAERFPVRLAPLLSELEGKLSLTKPVRYLTSFRVNSPFTAGWLRPVVMFPRGLLGELNEDQLRTIIAHELAHIKRYDFLVNMIQTLLCILFFYHPAAWWISARIDEEREHCCDDLAIEATGEPVGYARTLLRLKETEIAQSGLAMGLLGKGDGFKDRVARLITGALNTGTYGEGFTTAVILFCFMGLAVTLSGQDQGAEPSERAFMPSAAELQVQGENIGSLEGIAPPPPAPRGIRDHYVGTEDGLSQEQADQINAVVRDVVTKVNEALVEDEVIESKFDMFIRAIWEGDLELVEYFLENENFDLNQTDDNQFTPLMAAASEDHPEIARSLINAGAKVNFVNENGWTALIEAADEGSYATALVLLEAGADPNLKGGNNDRSALAVAGSEGHTHLFSLLIQHGADVFSAGGGMHPLHTAAEEGQLQAVEQLLGLQADINVTEGSGRTPLSYAAEEGNTAVVKLLLKRGADVNHADQGGWSPLHYAIGEGQRTIVKMLLAAKADLTAGGSSGTTPLDHALNEMLDWLDGELEALGPGMTFNDETGYPRDATVEIVWKLLDAGAKSDRIRPDKGWIESEDGRIAFPYILDRNAKVYRGDGGQRVGSIPRGNRNAGAGWTQRSGAGRAVNNGTPSSLKATRQLVAAVGEDDIDEYDFYLETGADINGFDAKGYSPLTMASFVNHNIDTDRLINLGADPNQPDGRGYTPLTEAAKHNHFNVVRTLLEKGADPDRVDREGKTAREYALQDGSLQILRLLNKAGANVAGLDEEGTSPLHVPAREGQLEMVRYLIEQGADPNAGKECAPLFLAAREGHGEVVRLLAGNEANLEATCNYRDVDYFRRSVGNGKETLALYTGGTSLMVALTQSSQDIVSHLLRLGANVDHTCNKARFLIPANLDYTERENLRLSDLKANHEEVYIATGWTPLMEAVESGKAELVQLLLRAGANKNLATREGLTALQLAEDLGFSNIVALLR